MTDMLTFTADLIAHEGVPTADGRTLTDLASAAEDIWVLARLDEDDEFAAPGRPPAVVGRATVTRTAGDTPGSWRWSASGEIYADRADQCRGRFPQIEVRDGDVTCQREGQFTIAGGTLAGIYLGGNPAWTDVTPITIEDE